MIGLLGTDAVWLLRVFWQKCLSKLICCYTGHSAGHEVADTAEQPAAEPSGVDQRRHSAEGHAQKLVAKLQSHVARRQLQAAWKICRFTSDGASEDKHAIIAADTVPLLVAKLGSDDSGVQAAAAHAMFHLSSSQ